MSFEFKISCPSGPVASSIALEPLEDTADYEYLVMQGCRILSDVGCSFHIAGFDSADWGFDVSYGMSTLIEQIPSLVESLKLNGTGEVDFYSQGVERGITFERVDGSYEIHCHSRTSWKPSPSVERLDCASVEDMLDDLTFDFSMILERAASEISTLEPFRSWRRVHESP
ncbi:hypothetical protein EF908_32545 [Streptomyces sp. WAC04770]|nr:hypothetical protein [Streptomyces sp. WAC04770]RST19030.1 hypothetical protein EF908_32545 [Streptomyces sp. WAC04770]